MIEVRVGAAVLFVILATGCASTTRPRPAGGAGVFVVGGIHQAHEKAKKYTYERMGELVEHLRPDVLCVEVLEKYAEDGSNKGMPYDFKRFMIPAAKERGISIVGIDWWDDTRGAQWQQLQQKFYSDPALTAEISLLGGMFQLLDEYFMEKDFQEINAPEITALWEAKSELKYEVYRQHPEYRPLFEFERERNEHMVENVLRALARHPEQRVMVAVGIDHKYFLERALRLRGVRVLDVKAAMAEWWTHTGVPAP